MVTAVRARMCVCVWFQALLVFLRKVVSHQDQNRMSLWNVSMVMSPNLFSCLRPISKSSAAKQQQEMEGAVGGAYLIRLMITHQDLLWTVSVITTSLRPSCLVHLCGHTCSCCTGPQLPVDSGETHEPGLQSERADPDQDQTAAEEEERQE